MARKTMAACLQTPDTPFEFTTSRPSTFAQAGIDCCREAAEKFGSKPTLKGVRTGNKRPRLDDDQTLPRDSVLEVVGPHVQSGFANGELLLAATFNMTVPEKWVCCSYQRLGREGIDAVC